MNPFSSGTRLRDMIRAIRACKTAAEERAVVRKECAAIRSAISESDQGYRHRNIAKLMFIHMLGYPTHFGQMECLKLIASAGFPEKRIGYLGLMLLLDERQEVLMLVTNSLKQDLNHSNQYIVGLALCALGNICSTEMARDLAPEVERLLLSRDPNIKKKAALCSIRIIRKVPDLAENFLSLAATLLKEKHHGVLISGVQLCTDLCKVSEDASNYLRKNCTEGLVRILKDVSSSPYSPEFDIAGITDPFLHIRVLRLMRMCGQGDSDTSEYINDILAQVASKTELNKNAGNAILYECVETIMGIEATSGLRVLAINILGRFLSNRDNNIRYVALNMLIKAVAVDSQAVQRHRTTILECVKDSDASIRKRALELVYLLVNDINVKPLTKELIDYLEVVDHDFKGDLTAKICSIVEKFSQEKKWYIDQMFKVLSLAGNYVKDNVWHALIVVISNAPDLQGYSVRSLYKAFYTSPEQVSLVRVTVWCIGEYGEMLVNNIGVLEVEEPMTVTESDAVDVLEARLISHSSDTATRSMSLIALLKLSSRFPPTSGRVKEIITVHKGSFVLELQQRAIEFNSIIQRHQNIKSSLVERMPVLDESTVIVKRAGPSQASISTEKSNQQPPSGTSLKLPNGVAKPAAAPLVDLLDLSSDDTPVSAPTSNDFLHDLLGIDLTNSSSGIAPASGTDILMDLLSIGTPPVQSNTSPEISSDKGLSLITKPASNSVHVVDLLDGLTSNGYLPEVHIPVYSSITAFQSSTLKITFSFTKQPDKPQVTQILATFINLSFDAYTDFVFQAAVPKFVKLHLDPASSNHLPSNGNGAVTQTVTVTNGQHGQKSLAMRIRIAYKVNNQEKLELGQINNFPPGL
ncbi:AP-1 complex subunit gamma-2-like isoform X1 [Zingiber officinale]|uniref:AP-1 complex subunit gamma-2-like isoform X1 n=3 Tax=Zingiber officinale TaxID=94328 RepID=UPI001C4BB54F|nr:AP-1 complex subunit gamma-2-like isoform X1 [Zingiber officinale]XP_042393218.1 AP-1 complex subunit gamma-2-like isoform X1 [Zingiber officinale]